ncbi:udp-glucose,sterol transferase [Fusarium sporotrichioides]|uniref:Beta-glucosidase cel3A n=1 Tax=Fusarium sporotrichioides TaxID=5514 RepID=A0A395SDV0_FUSSP|nr:udp-glucose,sterol transferase [Fusarium sporotrichioides]
MYTQDKPLPGPPTPRHPSPVTSYEAGPSNHFIPDEAPPQYTAEPAATARILDEAAGATGMMRMETFLFPEADTETIADGRIDLNLDSKLCRTLSILIDRNGPKRPDFDQPASIVPPAYTEQAEWRIRLNIVIQVVGSRGDVQPFVALGNELQRHGHRVRLATHNTFADFVRESGLEFYPIGGDPTELMAYMVKNPGLIPSIKSLRAGDVQKKRVMIAEMLEGCWRSCIEPDPVNQQPFVADAIIANPPSFAHVHCAQALGIPLHLMFTMPWSSTKHFCHPLANINANDSGISPAVANQISYMAVEWMTWQGQSLDLEDIPFSEGAGLLETLQIPFTYCWSPALIPKPLDWPDYIDVCGFFFRDTPQYTPESGLAAFLRDGPPPIYIGFGSIVIEDADKLTAILVDAVKETGVRAIISKGWSKLGANQPADKDIFYLGDCPHEWLFQQVTAVVHHGGAGTTACGLLNGKPTAIVPFFGDQPFWGTMVHAAGAGPMPIPQKMLDSQNLSQAIRECLTPGALAAARGMAEKMRQENGVRQAVHSFHANLPLDKMRCDIIPGLPAAWSCKLGSQQLKLSKAAAEILTDSGRVKWGDLKSYKTQPIDIQRQRWDPLTAVISSGFKMYAGMVTSAADIVIKPAQVLMADGPNTADPKSAESPNTQAIEDPVCGRYAGLELPEGNQNRRNQKSRAGAAVAGSAGAFGGILKAFSKGVYLDIPHALEEGMRVAPRLYGGEVYDPGPVTDWKSGGIAAGKNFGHGLLEGVGGLVMSPVRGAKKEGAIGAAKGVGIGVLNLTTKVTSGTLGLLTFTSQGAYKSVRASMRRDTRRAIKQSKQAEGIAIVREGKQRIDAAAVLRVFDGEVVQMSGSRHWKDFVGLGLVSHTSATLLSQRSTPSWENASEQARRFVAQLNTTEKIGIATGGYRPGGPACIGSIGKVERLGFKGICFSDGPSGFTRSDGVSVFSSGLTAAASWDRYLIYERAVALGEEFRAKGSHVLLGPSCGPMGRNVLGGRNWEGFGPDPYLSGVAMNASVSGIQSVGVQACSKHFIGNEQETQRTRTTKEDGTVIEALSSNIDERTLHELYLWPFADAVKAGTASIMCSYNRVNQTYACANPHLLSLLKDELAFPGYVVSDWLATHGTAPFANAGLDLEMPGSADKDDPGSYFGEHLLDAISDKNVTESRLDEMAERVMRPYFFLGQDKDFPDLDPSSAAFLIINQFSYNNPDFPVVAIPARDVRDEHPKGIRELGAAATVMLKNTNGTLPLKKQARNVGIFGNGSPYPAVGAVYLGFTMSPISYEIGTLDQGGGSGTVRHTELIAPLDAIRERVKEEGGRVQILMDHQQIIYNNFRSIYPLPDVCLVFLKAFATETQDRQSLDLDWNATTVVENIAALCSNTVVIIHGPGPVLMPWADNENVTAILSAHYPGEEIGNSIVDVLWGDTEPAGRLPYTIAKNLSDYGAPIYNLTEPADNPNAWSVDYTEGQLIDYRHFDAMNIEPQYEFGFGLSYTTFDMSTELTVDIATGIEAQVNESKGKAPGGWVDLWEQAATVSVKVHNTGDRDGHAVPQLYVSFPRDTTPPGTPVRVLRGFEKVHLKAGESKKVVFPLQRRDLSFWDEATRQWVIPEGTFTFAGGFSSRDLRAKTEISVLGFLKQALSDTYVIRRSSEPTLVQSACKDGLQGWILAIEALSSGSTGFTMSFVFNSRSFVNFLRVYETLAAYGAGIRAATPATRMTPKPPSESRRTHKKSRTGCDTCKKRRVKCDEAHPRCAKCTLGNRTCSYTAAAAPGHDQAGMKTNVAGSSRNTPAGIPLSTQSFTAAAASSSTVTAPGRYDAIHMSLFHYAIINMTSFMGVGGDSTRVLESALNSTRVAPYLLDQLLALSALYQSTASQQTSQDLYLRYAIELQTRALAQFLETRGNINETNYIPAFLFTSFLGIHVLYNTFRDHQDNLGEFVSAFVDYARVHQGVRAVVANYWPQILASNLAPLLSIVEVGNRIDQLEAGTETIELRKQLEALPDSSRMPVTASIDALRRMQWVLDLANYDTQNSSSKIQAAIAWPVIISDDYIDALYLRHPEALAVLAFFVAFVYENRSYWVFQPCAESLIKALANHLGPFWKQGLSWPLSRLVSS